MIYLYQDGSKILRYTITDVPSGTTITGARFTLKADPEAADSAALIDQSVTDSLGEFGQVVDTGADGEGAVEIYIDEDDLSALGLATWYHVALQITLDSGERYVVPESVESVRVRAGA